MARREAAEAYIRSQTHQGWAALAERYDDGGFSGGTLERPALQRLLTEIDAGRVDCVVVYKVDRLSRSLLDFARLMERFDRRGVSFVAVTQQLNTTTSVGRLTLNILLSFVQFERAIIAERTRDKMRAARQKGKWIGGMPVLGYDVAPAGGRLAVNEREWAIDFVTDGLARGRGLRILTIVDSFTRECPAIEVDTGMSSWRVTLILDWVISQRGKPDVLRCDNGPEFTSRHFLAWCEERGIRLLHIQPGRPMQNGHVESFNGRFRDECLNHDWFTTLADAREKIERWRMEYNQECDLSRELLRP